MRISDWSSDVCSSDLIRRRGMKVTPVRAAGDLVPLVESDDRIILVADGLRAGGTHYAAIAKPGSPAILVTGDTMLTPGFERIDATRRWGGLATISQPMVAELSGTPGGSIGRRVCRESVVQYVLIWVVTGTLKKSKNDNKE